MSGTNLTIHNTNVCSYLLAKKQKSIGYHHGMVIVDKREKNHY